MEVNQNWLADQVESSDRVRELESEVYEAEANYMVELARANRLEQELAIMANKLRELVTKKEAKGG